MPRIKPETIETIESFHANVDRVVDLEIRIKAAEAKRDSVVAKIERSYNPEIEQLRSEQQLLATQAAAYANKHRAVLLPGKKKSASSPSGVYGFRSSTKLKLLGSEEDALEALQKAGFHDYTLTVEKLDKDALKADLDTRPGLPAVATLKKEDTFFIKPKPELAEPKS